MVPNKKPPALEIQCHLDRTDLMNEPFSGELLRDLFDDTSNDSTSAVENSTLPRVHSFHPAFDLANKDEFRLHFNTAKAFFSEFPNEVKLHRGNKKEADAQYIGDFEPLRALIKNSMIRITGSPSLLMIASVDPIHTIGRGTSGCVKFALDESNQLYVIKIFRALKKRPNLKTATSFYKPAEKSTSYAAATPPNKLSPPPEEKNIYKEHEKLKDLKQGIGDSPLHRKNKHKFYIVEKFLGLTLSQKLANDTLSTNQRIALAIEIALGIDALHTGDLSICGIRYAHGDLKPENITVNQDGIHLIDYGSCMTIDDSATHRCKGTPIYLPIDSKQYETDVFDISSIRRKAQKVLDSQGPVFLDIIALKRIIYLPKELQNKKHIRSILRQEDFELLPLWLQQKLNTESIKTNHTKETALSLATDLSNFLIDNTALTKNTSHRQTGNSFSSGNTDQPWRPVMMLSSITDLSPTDEKKSSAHPSFRK